MFQAHFFTVEAQSTLTRMQIQIRDVGHELMPHELEDWQVEDMNRQYPNTETPDYVTAVTLIWPRSRTYEKTRRLGPRAFPKRIGRPLSPRPRLIGVTPAGAKRPILRPVLLEKLQERMAAMLVANLQWVTSQSEGAQAPTSERD